MRVRRGTACLGLAGLATLGLVAVSPSAQAVHAQDIQLDGNTTPVGIADPALDWESFFTGPGDIHSKAGALPSSDFLARGSVADYALPEFSTFATGSKDTLDLTGWQCGKSNNLGAKDDLVNVYTAAYRNPANQHLLLYFGAEKSSNLGDNNIGIWFLQDHAAGCTVPANGHNTDWTGKHVIGDVLLTAAFTNGGTQAAVEAHAWKSTGLGAAQSGFLCTAPTATQLADPGSDTSPCAITNLSEFSPPWTHPLKTAGANGTDLAVQEFYEGGVDVTQLEIESGNPNADPCISTFVADTRSSQSPTATLFDYAMGSIPVCAPSTTMTTSTMTKSADPIAIGQSVTFTVTEKNDGTDPLTAPAGGFVQSAECSPWDYVSGDTNTNTKLDPNETWTFSCATSFASAGSKTVTVYGHGLDSRFANQDVTYCATPDATKICDADETNSISVTVINPSTDLTFTGSTPTVRTVHSGDAVTLTWTETNDATGAANVLSPPTAGNKSSFMTADNGCTPAYVSGDTTANNKLDPGETYTFSCTVHPSASVTITATGHGIDAVGRDVTVCSPTCTTTQFDDADETDSASIVVINPTTDLTFTGSTPTVRTIHSGEAVTLTWTETNDATGAANVLSPPTAGNKSSFMTADNGCTPAYVSGDTTVNNKLDPGETYTFTCTVNPTADVTITATGHGIDAVGADVTYCATSSATQVCDTDERDSAAINVINPTTTLSGSGSALVTLTWVETNDALQTDEVLTNPSVTANNGCSPVSSVGADGKNIGDTNKDGKLDAGEHWTFTCQITVGPGTSTTVTATGFGTDATGKVVTYCAAPDATKVCDSDERSSVTVTVS